MRREATRVLVTGGCGFLGHHLVRALVAGGHSVRVLDDLSTGKRERLGGMAVELLHADARNPAAIRRALDGAEIVFHLAGVPAPTADAATGSSLTHAEEVNVGGVIHLLHAATQTRPERIVIAGSGAVYGRAHAYLLHEEVAPLPSTPDAAQRLAVEHYARLFQESHGVPSVVLRLFRVFGPGEAWDAPGAGLVPRLCRAAIEDAPPLIVGDGRQTRDLVYVDNAVQAMLQAASVRGVDGEVINVASGEAVSVAHLWSVICELTGRRKDPPQPLYAPSPPWEPPHVRASIARAGRLLSWTPTVKLRDGLARTVQHFRSQRQMSANGWFTPPAPAPEPSPFFSTAATLPPSSATHSPSSAMHSPSSAPHSPSSVSPIPSSASLTPPPLPSSPSLSPTPIPSSHARSPSSASPMPWPRATRAVPPPPPPPRLIKPHPSDRTVEKIIPVDDDAIEAVELDVEWAPVPPPPGQRRA